MNAVLAIFIASGFVSILRATPISLQGCFRTTCADLQALPQVYSGVCQRVGVSSSFVLFLPNEEYPTWNVSLIQNRNSRQPNQADLCWVQGNTNCDMSQNPVCQVVTSGECYQPVLQQVAFYNSALAKWDGDSTTSSSLSQTSRIVIIAVSIAVPFSLAIIIIVTVAVVKPVRSYFFPPNIIHHTKLVEEAEETGKSTTTTSNLNNQCGTTLGVSCV